MSEELIEILTAALPCVTAIGTVGGFLTKMVGKAKEIKTNTQTTVNELKNEVQSLKSELTTEVKKVNDASDAQAIRQQYMTVLNEVTELKKELQVAINQIKRKR